MSACQSRGAASWACRAALSLAIAVAALRSQASASTSTLAPPDAPGLPAPYRPGDILYIGHDGSSVSAFTHAPLANPSSTTNISSLLAGDDWNNVRIVDVNSRGTVILADIDGPAIFTTQLGTGGMRVLSGRSPGSGDQFVGDGPPIRYMSDMEFGPDGFVYLLTYEEIGETSARQVMRIDPENGSREIVAAIEPPLGVDSRFAFAPSGDLFVTLSSIPTSPDQVSSHNPMPPPSSAIMRVDVQTGVLAQFPSVGHTYEFRIDDIAIAPDGRALLLAENYLHELDLATGATTRQFGYFEQGREVEIAPGGSPIVLSFNYGFEGNIHVLGHLTDDVPANSVITPRPFNTPFTMALVPVPEPSAGATVAVILAISAAWRLCARRGRR